MVAFLTLGSCAARKSDRQETSESAKIDYAALFNEFAKIQEKYVATASLKTNAVTKATLENKATSTVDNWEPVDPSIEASIVDADGKKTVFNNLKRTQTTSTEDKKENTEKTESTDQQYKIEFQKQEDRITALEQKLQEAIKKESESKNVDKKAVSGWSLWWLFLIAGVTLLVVFNEPILHYINKKRAQS